jgi:hypothetical protein
MSLILIGFYLITWTPYAIAAMYSVFLKYFSNLPTISPILATIPALFAKSSLVWPGILNLVLMKKQRKEFADMVEESSKRLFIFNSFKRFSVNKL